MRRVSLALTLILTLLALPLPSWAGTSWERDFGIQVFGEPLTPPAAATLRFFLTQMPRDLYPWLRFITVNNFPLLAQLALECPEVEGTATHIGCGINTFPVSALGQFEKPFPPDAPDADFVVNQLYGATGHELTHLISQSWGHRWHGESGPPLDSPDYPVDRGYSAWTLGLIQEAGCNPQNYLRSMLPSCFFRDNPQEKLASDGNQWLACSKCVLRLGLQRWDAGIPHPLNQAVMALAVWSSKGGSSYLPTKQTAGVVHAYRYISPGVAEHELWTVFPWRCPGPVQVTGQAFSLGLELDPDCRVLAVTHREGV
jgi:hypothetical protein